LHKNIDPRTHSLLPVHASEIPEVFILLSTFPDGREKQQKKAAPPCLGSSAKKDGFGNEGRIGKAEDRSQKAEEKRHGINRYSPAAGK